MTGGARGERWARLALLAGLAASQLTLAARGGVGDFTVMAALSWLAGAILLLEREEEGAACAPGAVPAGRWWAGALALLWCLLVLSFAGRLHDPLFWLLPLLALAGLALIGGLGWRAPLLRQLVVLGLLLPAQGLFNVAVPVAPLARVTARVSAQLLWLVGQPAFAEGDRIVMLDQMLLVDGGCTGRSILAFGLATLVALLILLPLPRRGRGAAIAALTAVILAGVFLLNGVRIALLAFTVRDPGPGALAALRGFEFWHSGPGAQLFSLAASALVCGVYVLLLEWWLRRSGQGAP
ncbi:MAG: archaeosortase/exosortase family protein [Cyanobium sp. Prado107]|nr:archaeosortase/exosortase family protein [Cyanobium sp. Prado107]